MSKFSFVLLPDRDRPALVRAAEVNGQFIQWFKDTYPGIFATSSPHDIIEAIHNGAFYGFDIDTAASIDELLKRDGITDAKWYNSNETSFDLNVVTMDRWVDELVPSLEKLAKIVGNMRLAEDLFLYDALDDNFEVAYALLDGRAVWHREKKNRVINVGDHSVEFLS